MVSKLQSEQVALEQKIKDLEKEDREITNLINQAKIKATKSSKNKVYSVSGGRLAHPVPAFAGHPLNDSYGPRIHPISKRKSFHAGLDLKATYGTDIVAAEAGTVIYSGSRGGYGKTVIIDHGNGLTTLYAHNSKLVVSQGESVKRGQVVAKAGSTGYSTGVHAHFEVRINGKTTLYAHNSKLVVSQGESVKRGQVVAKAGSTGYSTGVHAHFEVRINGKHTDPEPYLK